MIDVPSVPMVGRALRANDLARIIEAIRKCRPIAGVGVRISTSPGGSVISCDVSGSMDSKSHKYAFDIEGREEGSSIKYYIVRCLANYGSDRQMGAK